MTHIIDGKSIAADLRNTIAGAVAQLQQNQGIQPGLAVVLVGEDPASQVLRQHEGETDQRVRHGLVSAQTLC